MTVNHVPDDVLMALSELSGRVALVVGAGCSLEDPTSLELARTYALQLHDKLLRDGVLIDGDCGNPEDLSAVADAVMDKRGTQKPVVDRLPRRDFRLARANEGYLCAAALLRERAVIAVLTLNFDLALTAALSELSASEVDVVPGPRAMGDLGSATVVYLHRNVDEDDPEKWILTTEALTEAWRDNWEEVVARRVMTSPVVIFAGLGSPAAVLTETITRVRQTIDIEHQRALVVDPADSTEFEEALDLSGDSHVQSGWCDFMKLLASRVAEELRARLTDSCQNLCSQHNWGDKPGRISSLTARLYESGLVAAGKTKAAWLLDTQNYAPDDERRELVADLLLGIGLIEEQLGFSAAFSEDGLVYLLDAQKVRATLGVASGRGSLRWAALEARVSARFRDAQAPFRPDYVLLSGLVGLRPDGLAPPTDIAFGDAADDITYGHAEPVLVMVDEVREGSITLDGAT